MNDKFCARKALDLGNSLDQLNNSLFGVNKIGDKIQEFAQVCDVQTDHIEKLTNIGIEQWHTDNAPIARTYINLAKLNTYASALEKITQD